MPDDFFNEINKWATECQYKKKVHHNYDRLYKNLIELSAVIQIALDKRLGCLKETDPSSDAQRLIGNVKIFFETVSVLELKMSPWKVVSTPTWRKFVNALDDIAE